MFKLSKAESSVILLLLTLFVSVVAIVDQSRRASDDMIERTFSNAQDLVDFVVVANRYYIESVSGVDVNELTAYPEREPHKIWLPATFATRYTQSYSEQNPEVDFRIYSADPFSFNRDRVLDDFGRNALDELLPSGVAAYRAVEELDEGTLRVRLARPFLMDANCVACHNRPEWELQNQNWEVGDVRGVWEASILVSPVNLFTQVEMLAILIFIGIACLLGVFVVFPAVRNEVKDKTFFHDRSVSMEKKATLNLIEAHTDPLTQIGNRRYFDAVFEAMVKEHLISNKNMAVVFFDIDHFKRVNDTYGHDVGDKVIKTVVTILNQNTRRKDKRVRFGGEEFVVLVPDLFDTGVMEIAHRIKDNVEQHTFTANNENFTVTVSAGVAFLNDNENAHDLFKRADELLYNAKNSGRNNVCDSLL